jgi:hypothetical protein
MVSHRVLSNAAKLFGTTIREIGILGFVFAPLEAFLREPKPPMDYVFWIVGLCLLFIIGGIIIEARSS